MKLYAGKDKKVLVRESNLYIMGITVFHPLMNEGRIICTFLKKSMLFIRILYKYLKIVL